MQGCLCRTFEYNPKILQTENFRSRNMKIYYLFSVRHSSQLRLHFKYKVQTFGFMVNFRPKSIEMEGQKFQTQKHGISVDPKILDEHPAMLESRVAPLM